MEEINLTKICNKNCKKCIYHTYASNMICCNYILIEQHSRIFENGVRKEIPEGYCDKYLSYIDGGKIKEKYSKKMHKRSVASLPKEEVYNARI